MSQTIKITNKTKHSCLIFFLSLTVFVDSNTEVCFRHDTQALTQQETLTRTILESNNKDDKSYEHAGL